MRSCSAATPCWESAWACRPSSNPARRWASTPVWGFCPGRWCASRISPGSRIPHTGWNQLWPQKPSALLDGLEEGVYAYFNHSFYCAASDPHNVLALTDYGFRYPSMVQRGNLYGIQFHPEKSQRVGLKILDNFIRGE